MAYIFDLNNSGCIQTWLSVQECGETAGRESARMPEVTPKCVGLAFFVYTFVWFNFLFHMDTYKFRIRKQE